MYPSSTRNFQERGNQPDSLAVAIQGLITGNAPHREVARIYCRHGIPVFPLRPGTKSPFMKGGHHVAAIDEAKIVEWWTAWPDAMVGIPAGPPSGIWVLDLDERAAESKDRRPRLGITTLRLLGFEPSLVAKCIVETPSAGQHLAFRLPTGLQIPNRAGDIAAGIDVRGTTTLRTSTTGSNADQYTAPGYENWPQIVSGGYFVAAGSKRVDGRRYAFKASSYLSAGLAPLALLRLAVFSHAERSMIEADPKLERRLASVDPQRWPEVYVERRAEKAAEAVGDSKGHKGSAPGDVGAYARSAYESARASLLAAREGRRDCTLWNVACSLMELVKADALDRATVEVGLREAALSIGLEERVVDDKLRRAYGQVEARDLSHVRGSARRCRSANGKTAPGSDVPEMGEPEHDHAAEGDDPIAGDEEPANEGDIDRGLPPIPVGILDIPGPMGDLACYLRDIDPVGDEMRALALAIGTMTAAVSGAFKCESANDLVTYTDLIIVNVGDSASGKTSQLHRIQNILKRAVDDPSQRPYRRATSFGSPEGFWDMLAETEKKRGVCAITVMIDEFGGELAVMSRDNSYKRGVAEILRSITNAGGAVLDPPAMSQRSKAADRLALNYPVVSVIGITTAKQFLEPLSSNRLLEDGTEGRFLVLASQPKREYDEVDIAEPEVLVPRLKIITQAMLDVARAAVGREPARIAIRFAPDIKEALKQLRIEQHRDADALERQGDPWGPMIRRRVEHITKLAMLWVISKWAAYPEARSENPVLDQAALSWAKNVVEYKEAGHRAIREGHISRSQRSEENRHLRERILAKVRRDHQRLRRRKEYLGVALRDVMRDLDLDRDEASKTVNSLLAQGKLWAADRQGKAIDEVLPKNQRVLLKPSHR